MTTRHEKQQRFNALVAEAYVMFGLGSETVHADSHVRLGVDGEFGVAFTPDDNFLTDDMLVYIDLGPLQASLPALLRANYELRVGGVGVYCMHPDKDHVIFSYRFPMGGFADGKALVNSVFDVIERIASRLAQSAVRQPGEPLDWRSVLSTTQRDE